MFWCSYDLQNKASHDGSSFKVLDFNANNPYYGDSFWTIMSKSTWDYTKQHVPIRAWQLLVIQKLWREICLWSPHINTRTIIRVVRQQLWVVEQTEIRAHLTSTTLATLDNSSETRLLCLVSLISSTQTYNLLYVTFRFLHAFNKINSPHLWSL